jgi:hypothetical protein
MSLSQKKLETFNHIQIGHAGPRYTPAVEPNAPNIQIGDLSETISTLSASASLFSRLKERKEEVVSHFEKLDLEEQKAVTTNHTAIQLLHDHLDNVSGVPTPVTAKHFRNAQKICQRLCRVAEKFEKHLYEQTQGDPSKREKIQNSSARMRRLINSLYSLQSFLGKSKGLYLGKNSIFISGEWGTGKTHFLCDITKNRNAENKTTVLILGHQITRSEPPLEAICNLINKSLAERVTTSGLLNYLERCGKKINCRSLIVVDGINESEDYFFWKKALKELSDAIKPYNHIGLIVSCRTPYENVILNKQNRSNFEFFRHQGFQDNLFDAQQEFFKFYNIPSPEHPPLISEFSKPLFLKIACKAFGDLSSRSKKKRFNEIYSGQKAMTFVFETFCKEIGKKIERDFNLPPKICWNILKSKAPHLGFAAQLAENNRTYLFESECLEILRNFTAIKRRPILKRILDRFRIEGLLIRDLHYLGNNNYEDVFRISYNKFSDHVIARYLLEKYLNKDSPKKLKRSFYKNTPIGKVFLRDGRYGFHDEWDATYANAGLAEAIIIELPEYLKRICFKTPTEAFFLLPERNKDVLAYYNSFLPGIFWRNVEAFKPETKALLDWYIANANEYKKDNIFETLVSLASRDAHPFNAKTLFERIDKLDIPERDEFWSEFVRSAEDKSAIETLFLWIEHICKQPKIKLPKKNLANLITLLSTFLTSTNRLRRDKATRSLYLLGNMRPDVLFEATLKSLAFNDPYLPERMLAASYGTTLYHWGIGSKKFKDALVNFAKSLIAKMFIPNAPHFTPHVLIQDYARNCIKLAQKANSKLISPATRKYIFNTSKHFPSKFPKPNNLKKDDVKDADSAIHMDFGNYTIGHLVKGRANYDYKHRGYINVLKQIKWRILHLGYSSPEIRKLDERNQSYQREWRGLPKHDRYGKKYSHIAFFELYGERAGKNLFDEHREDYPRPPDCDIDPSFPTTASSEWRPKTKKLFTAKLSDVEQLNWFENGEVPRYKSNIAVKEIDGQKGPWICTFAELNQTSSFDDRRVFTFIHALLINPKDRLKLKQLFEAETTNRNHGIHLLSDHYTFGGEIPWSHNFGSNLRTKTGIPRKHTEILYEAYRSKQFYSHPRNPAETEQLAREGSFERYVRSSGVKSEVINYVFEWESYHSILNATTGVFLPTPKLCHRLKLKSIRNSFDLYDAKNRPATLFRRFGNYKDEERSVMLFLRKDLLERYAEQTKQEIVWLCWGERGFHPVHGHQRIPDDLWDKQSHIYNNLIFQRDIFKRY